MRRYFYLLIPLFLFGCSDSSSHTEPNHSIDSGSSNEETVSPFPKVNEDLGNAVENAKLMRLFLYGDRSVSTFEGEGNEFASYFVETNWLSDHYVEMLVNNGGVELLKYYRVNENGIYLIEQLENDGQSLSIEYLETLEPISTYFAPPLEVGTTFEGWMIRQTDAHYTTPYASFDQVIVITKSDENTEQRNYFVTGIGQIASEFESTDEHGNVEIISSKLKSIEIEKDT